MHLAVKLPPVVQQQEESILSNATKTITSSIPSSSSLPHRPWVLANTQMAALYPDPLARPPRFPQNTANIFVAAFIFILIWMTLKLVAFWMRREWDKVKDHHRLHPHTTTTVNHHSLPTPIPIVPVAPAPNVVDENTTATTTTEIPPPAVFAGHPIPTTTAGTTTTTTHVDSTAVDRMERHIVKVCRSAEIARVAFTLIISVAIVQAIANVNHHAITVLIWIASALFLAWTICYGIVDRAIINLAFGILTCKTLFISLASHDFANPKDSIFVYVLTAVVTLLHKLDFIQKSPSHRSVLGTYLVSSLIVDNHLITSPT